MPTLGGRPVAVVFDGTGANHSTVTHPVFELRWMASQLQNTPGFAQTLDYWSWMDGSMQPVLSLRAGVPEAATASSAFFAGNGWLDASTAAGKQGGSTLLQTAASALARAGSQALPILWVNQWNEFAGQSNGQGYGPNQNIYVDIYSSELGNDMEPTSLTACAYRRPGVLCGGYGFQQLNLLQAVAALAHSWPAQRAASPLALSSFLFLNQPAWGVDGASQTQLALQWSAFQISPAGPPLSALNLTVADLVFSLDGSPVAPTPTGPQSATLPAPAATGALHSLVLSLRNASALHTRFPVAADVLFPSPLLQPVAPSAQAWFFL
jgi:hypothetical protein